MTDLVLQNPRRMGKFSNLVGLLLVMMLKLELVVPLIAGRLMTR